MSRSNSKIWTFQLILHKWVYYIQGATQSERSSSYYKSGYITSRSNSMDHDDVHNGSSESMGENKTPSAGLYDLSLVIYTFFKNRKVKCCSQIFLQAFKFIYECGSSSSSSSSSISLFLQAFKFIFECTGYTLWEDRQKLSSSWLDMYIMHLVDQKTKVEFFMNWILYKMLLRWREQKLSSSSLVLSILCSCRWKTKSWVLHDWILYIMLL